MIRLASRWMTICALLALLASAPGCGDEAQGTPINDPPEVGAVRATMKEGSFERSLRAGTVPNPKGAGTIVMMGNAKYLVKGTSVFAINAEAKGYSPSVPVTKEVRESQIKLP